MNGTTDDSTASCVEYVPPRDGVVEEFTWKVCDELASRNSSQHNTRQCRWAIADFLKLIAELTTKQMNRTQSPICQ